MTIYNLRGVFKQTVHKFINLYRIVDFVFIKSSKSWMNYSFFSDEFKDSEVESNAYSGNLKTPLEIEAFEVINKQRKAIHFLEINGKQELIILN